MNFKSLLQHNTHKSNIMSYFQIKSILHSALEIL